MDIGLDDGMAALLAAPLIGSFLGVVVVRLPGGRPVLLGRSACDHCDTPLGWRDLVPLVSGLLSRGRCRHCGASVGLFYPAMEIAALVPVAWAATVLSGWRLLAGAVLGWILLAIVVTDWRTRHIPLPLADGLLVAGLTAAFLLDPQSGFGPVLMAAGCFGGVAILSFVYRRLNRQIGVDLETAVLLAGLGAWMPWKGALTLIGFTGVAALLLLWLFPARSAMRSLLRTALAFGGWLIWLYRPWPG